MIQRQALQLQPACGLDFTRDSDVAARPNATELDGHLSQGSTRARAGVPVGWFQSPRILPVYLPFLLLALLTLFFRVSDADISICRWSYSGGVPNWLSANSVILQLLYDFGPAPALTLGIGGLVVGLLSLIWRSLQPYREAGFFFAAMLALGPGLIVNGILKPHWHRPRPVQTLAFGGTQPFVPVWESGTNPLSKSFPCGHASMGFYLLAPAFLLYRQRRDWALAFVALGLVAGFVIGAGRVLQGAHYPSDVVWSAGMVYLSGLVLLRALQWIKSVANGMGALASPAAEPVAVALRLPRRESGEAANPAATRRAA